MHIWKMQMAKGRYSSTLATSCKELTHWKRLWCWEGLGTGGDGDNRGWDGWMASPMRWTWVWVNSGSWWWTGRPGVLQFMGSQRIGHDWTTELNWTECKSWDESKYFMNDEAEQNQASRYWLSKLNGLCRSLVNTSKWGVYCPHCSTMNSTFS